MTLTYNRRVSGKKLIQLFYTSSVYEEKYMQQVVSSSKICSVGYSFSLNNAAEKVWVIMRRSKPSKYVLHVTADIEQNLSFQASFSIKTGLTPVTSKV